jgi:hypothetical protein
MKLLYNRHWHITIRRPEPQGPILMQSDYLDTFRERSSRARIRPETLEILDAEWEEYRCLDGTPDSRVHTEPGLVGLVAYFDCGKEITRGLSQDPDGEISDLFKEGVKALIQAEALFLRDRGYASVEEYERFLLPKLKGTCFYTSHPQGNPNIIRDELRYHDRKGSLFSRYRFLSVYGDDGGYRVAGTFADGWHEMQIDLRLRADDYRITRASAEFTRAPDKTCPGSTAAFGRLIGLPLTPEGRKDALRRCGGGDGCAHLADLVAEAVKAVHSPWVQNPSGDPWPRRQDP